MLRSARFLCVRTALSHTDQAAMAGWDETLDSPECLPLSFSLGEQVALGLSERKLRDHRCRGSLENGVEKEVKLGDSEEHGLRGAAGTGTGSQGQRPDRGDEGKKTVVM